MQRSVSERSGRERSGSRGRHPISECPHRAKRARECRHRVASMEPSLRQQTSRLEHVQSTPNVATIHNSRFGSVDPRGFPSISETGNGSAAMRTPIGGSSANVSKLCSAVSDGELLDVAILPIFQKLLTERHKSGSRGMGRGYGSSVASCPNISIKCDIVEYL